MNVAIFFLNMRLIPVCHSSNAFLSQIADVLFLEHLQLFQRCGSRTANQSARCGSDGPPHSSGHHPTTATTPISRSDPNSMQLTRRCPAKLTAH
ncbi:hypothetical protein EI94DRAFT_632981 [Lactarius quietus]|nr:hypothetical protein EI94DRAFT_632981 [Lactarius quietus]